MTDLHNVDAVRRSRCDLDKFAADLFAGSSEFVSLDGRQNKALYAAHSHTQRQQLHGEGLAGTAGAQKVQVGVLVLLGIEQVNDAQGIIMPVDPQQHAGVVRHFEAGEHIGGSCTTGQHIALALRFQ